MGLIRLIIFALVIWLLWRMVKKFQAKQDSRKQSREKLENANMVLCKYCSVHVPENDAIRHEQMWFCSEDHRAKYLEDNS